MTPILPPLPADPFGTYTQADMHRYALSAIELNRPKVPEGLVEQLQKLKVDDSWNERNSYGWFVIVRAIDFLKSLQHEP